MQSRNFCSKSYINSRAALVALSNVFQTSEMLSVTASHRFANSGTSEPFRALKSSAAITAAMPCSRNVLASGTSPFSSVKGRNTLTLMVVLGLKSRVWAKLGAAAASASTRASAFFFRIVASKQEHCCIYDEKPIKALFYSTLVVVIILGLFLMLQCWRWSRPEPSPLRASSAAPEPEPIAQAEIVPYPNR